MSKDVVLLDTDNAAVVATVDDYVTVASKSGLRVLIKPSTVTEKTGIYILGKYLLKKCLTSVRYETTPVIQEQRFRSPSTTYGQQRRSNPPRERSGYSGTGQGFGTRGPRQGDGISPRPSLSGRPPRSS